MKVIFLMLAALAACQARPQNPADAVITKYDFNNIGYGGYSYSWSSSDGTSREETREVLNEGQENESAIVRGSFSYTGPDGVVYTVVYTAGDEGFEPEGEHIPPSAGVKKPQLGIPSAALASLSGGGLG